MRTLVISDIHGNAAALRAVAAVPFDFLVCLGDIVGYGPRPAECVTWVRSHADVVVQGNHDHAIGNADDPRCSTPFRWLAEATTPLQRAQLPVDDRRWLAALPRLAAFPLDGRRTVAVHATPSDPLYRYVGPDPVRWEAERDGVHADLLLVGHTHLPFDLTVSGLRIVNPGSVGQPKDGDPAAAFAVIEDGAVTLRRARYDVDVVAEQYREAGVPTPAAAALTRLLRTGSAAGLPTAPPAPTGG